MIHFIKYHLPVVIFVVGLFVLSSIPDLSPPDLGFKPQDKFYHLIFYMVFGFFIKRSFYNMENRKFIQVNASLFTLLFGAFYALSDEIHQFFVPGRFMSFGDFAADTLGLLIGIFIFNKLEPFLIRRKRSSQNV